ncbi:MAG: hypothetical protein ACE5F9_08255 [Phycisphaerae bacterium]
MIRVIMISLAGTILLSAGCAKTSDRPQRATHAQSGLMPADMPQADTLYLSNQSEVKLLPARTISYDSYESFIHNDDEEKTPVANASEAAGDDEAESERTASGGGAGGWLKKLAGKLTGQPGAEAEDAEESEDGADGADETDETEATSSALADARQAVPQVPPNPSGLSGKKVQQIKTAAEADARTRLIHAIMAFKFNPVTTIADLTDADADGVELNLPSMTVVGMKWLDAKRLQVEVQVRAGDAVGELQGQFDEADFSPLEQLDQDKYFTATGVGSVKESAAEQALPGKRAERAAGGLGI